MRLNLESYKKGKEFLLKLKDELYLGYLSDDVFVDAIQYFIEKKITKRQIQIITKHINNRNFDKYVLEKAVEFQKLNKDKKLTYNVEYISLRNNISISDAEKYVEDFKKKKSTCLENFIAKHGEKVGREKFEKFQKTSASSSSDEWFQRKFGENWKQKKKERFQNNGRSKEYWKKLGYSDETAKKLVSEFQKLNSGVHKEYYEKLGLTDDEISLIFLEINEKKGLHCRNRKLLIEKYGDDWLIEYEKNHARYREQMENAGVWIKLSLLDEFVKYKKLCWFYTNQSITKYDINDIEKRSKEFHLDHMFSIKAGFLNSIPPEIIGSIVNLQIIPKIENCKKRDGCSITKNKLIKSYKEYINENSKNRKV